MNILLGYEPYKGFEIHALPRKSTDCFGRPFNGYLGWAKRTSDGKCFDGGAVHRTISAAEDEMKSCVDVLLDREERLAGDTSNDEAAASIFFGL